MEVLEHNIIRVKIKDLKLDRANPNIMTKEQEEGLRESMSKFGYLAPIVIDQNNKIADGEHRLKIYKEFEQKEIPAIRVKFENDMERRLLRQSMNKIRGQHAVSKDFAELQLLMKYNSEELFKLVHVGEEQMDDLKRLVELNERDQHMTDHYEDSFLHGNVKQIIIYFTNEAYQDIIPKLQKCMESFGVDNNTDVFIKLVDNYLETHKIQTPKITGSE
jgi:hypothetical protein